MRVQIGLSCLLLVLSVFGVTAANAQSDERRVALVVGIGAYDNPNHALVNPINDARDMSIKLNGLGFEVIEAIDLDLAGLQRKLREFADALSEADAALFYYAGHGMEYAGRNYLFPTDATLDNETDVRLRLIDVDDVLWLMETAVPARLMILDACRNNPLALQLEANLPPDRALKVRRGLSPQNSEAGTFIAFATEPGNVALDGNGRNSPFTKALLSNLETTGLDADQLMREVRNEVIDETNGTQIPWNTSSLRGPFIFNDRGNEDNTVPLEAVDSLVWESIEDSDDPDVFRAYLDRFGSAGSYADEARLRLADGSARADNGFGPLDFYRLAMNRRIILGCGRTSNSPHFGLGPAPIPINIRAVRGDGISVRAASTTEGENLGRLNVAKVDEVAVTVIQTPRVGCASNERIMGDGRDGQWQAWHYLVASGGELIGHERDSWSGQGGSFRIESDLVTLNSSLSTVSNLQPNCRAFVAYNQINRRAFAGHACGSETPELATLGKVFDLLEWP